MRTVPSRRTSTHAIGSRRRRADAVAPEPELWLITFTDLLMVLVSMFALIFSMNVISETSLRATLARMRIVAPEAATPRPANDEWPAAPDLDVNTQATLHRLTDGLTHLLGAPSTDTVSREHRSYAGGIDLTYSASALTARLGPGSFAQDSAELTFQSEESIRVIARALKGTAFPIEIETHRKTRERIGDNHVAWKLAEERSLAVLRQFLDTGVGPAALSAAGYVRDLDTKVGGEGAEETIIRISFPLPISRVVKSVSSFEREMPISRVPQNGYAH